MGIRNKARFQRTKGGRRNPNATFSWQRSPPLPHDFDLSGLWKLTPLQEDTDIVHFMFQHEPGSNIFTGHQRGFDTIRDGSIVGDVISWRVDVFRVTGRIEDEGCRLTAIEVRSDLESDFLVVYSGEREEEEEESSRGTCAVC